ncbi:hypothetical protein [Paenibacillus sp. YIM B09110]|uniref:hypothetical protein n=1 Tax=Paenibacillus sp. YIM B09110 TaxID=3126102 RepID=UPI00301CC989
MKAKKRPGCLVIILIIVGVFILIGIIGALLSDSPPETANNSDSKTTGANASQKHEELFAEAQALLGQGKYIDAITAVDKAIKIEENAEYTKLKTDIEAKIKEKKTALEAKFEIKEDKVEKISFISPVSELDKGLVFYPYIGVNKSGKYMYLRVGYQEDASKALFVFTSIKVRAGEELEELKFNLLEKSNDVDLLGAGMTELVDIDVNKNTQKLLDNVVASTEDVIVRFEDISNQITDYTISKEQKQDIVDILEYYSYLE